MSKVISFGELLIRIESSSDSFFGQNVMSAFPGGAEVNVAVNLALLKIPAALFTAIPRNSITEEIVALLEKSGLDTSKILFQGDRIGTYTLLSSNGLSDGAVIYDRKYSSFSQLKETDFNWDLLFEDCSWFHWTAITPALSIELYDLMELALKEAHKRKLYISVDLNYRKKLWQYGKAPIEVMPALVQYCDVIMGNLWAEHLMLGTPIKEGLDSFTKADEYLVYSKEVASEIFKLFPKCKHIANTFRFMDNPAHNLFYGTYHSHGNDVISPIMETFKVEDRIGSGDAFMAGLISGIYNNLSPQQIINLAVKTGFDKLFFRGDFSMEFNKQI